MVSNKLIIAAFAALASVANASPCKLSSTKTVTTSATETTSAGFTSKTGTDSHSVETSTAITDSDTATESVSQASTTVATKTTTTATTTEAGTETTTLATSSEASTTVADTATTTTTVEEPLLTNSGFDDGTTSPWVLAPYSDAPFSLGNPEKGTSSGRVQFGVKNGGQYFNYITQKINKNALKAGAYTLSGSVRVDYSNNNGGDGCSLASVVCFRGPVANLRSVPNSQYVGGVYEAEYFTVSTTCEFTDSLLAQYDEFSVAFGFKCAESGANLDSVVFEPVPPAKPETTTMITTTQATTVATTTAGETATTTTTADAGPTPLLVNANFDLGTTEPWLSSLGSDGPVGLDTYQPKQGPASGVLHYGNDGGESYNNYVYQRVETRLLKASSYHLAGFVRVDTSTDNIYSDGCNSMGVLCTLGDPNNLNRVPGSVKSLTADSAAGAWYMLDTTCTFTDQMLSQYDYVTVSFGFNCANSGANLDAVAFKEVV
ncbi:hypothetical protein F53441_5042 [Fusarium austroafricanum]|uniref:CBM-cenC domain-containing protein n=1 Tax=Fusarium austroafricanum TaxID=2364996 RepID=A0A8H4KMN0_9HYPO|nr:hypothetical protein F53441_5042 [Fusarium austroafricanum]